MQPNNSQTNSSFHIKVVQTPTEIGKRSLDDEQTPTHNKSPEIAPNINLKDGDVVSDQTQSDSDFSKSIGMSPSMQSFQNRLSKRGSIVEVQSPFRRQMKSLIDQSLKKPKETKYTFRSSKLFFKNRKSNSYLKTLSQVVQEDLDEDEQDDRRLDLFEEMQTIEREFGSVYNEDQKHLFEVKPPNSLWYLVYDSLQRKPKFERLMESIEQAKIDADSNEEVKKKKLLEDYFKMKMLKNVPQTKVKTKEQELDEFIKTSNNPSKTLQEVKKMIEAEEKSHRGAKIKDVKRILEVIDDTFKQDETRLNYFKRLTNYKYPGVKYKGEQVQSKVNHRWSMQQWNNILTTRDQHRHLPKTSRRVSPQPLKINTSFLQSQVLSNGSTEEQKSPSLKTKFIQGQDINNLAKSNSPINKRNTQPFQANMKMSTMRPLKKSQATNRSRKYDSLDLTGDRNSQELNSISNKTYFQERTSSRIMSYRENTDNTPQQQTLGQFVNVMADYAFERIKATIAALDSFIYKWQQEKESRKRNKSQLSQKQRQSGSTSPDNVNLREDEELTIQQHPEPLWEDKHKFKKSELNKCLSQRIVLTNLAAAVSTRNLVLLDFSWVSYFSDRQFYTEFKQDIIPIIQLLKKFYATKEEDASYRQVLVKKLQQINSRVIKQGQTFSSLPSEGIRTQLLSPVSCDVKSNNKSKVKSQSTSNTPRNKKKHSSFGEEKLNRIAYRKLRKPTKPENKNHFLPNLEKPSRKFTSRQRSGSKKKKNLTSPNFSINHSKSTFREHLQRSRLAHLRNCQASVDTSSNIAARTEAESPLMLQQDSKEYQVTTSATHFGSQRGIQSAKNQQIYVPGQQSIELLTQRRKPIRKKIKKAFHSNLKA